MQCKDMSLIYFTMYHTHNDTMSYTYIYILKKINQDKFFEIIIWLNLSVFLTPVYQLSPLS